MRAQTANAARAGVRTESFHGLALAFADLARAAEYLRGLARAKLEAPRGLHLHDNSIATPKDFKPPHLGVVPLLGVPGSIAEVPGSAKERLLRARGLWQGIPSTCRVLAARVRAEAIL